MRSRAGRAHRRPFSSVLGVAETAENLTENEEIAMLARLQNHTAARLVVLMVAFLALNAAVAGPLSAMVETTSPFMALVVLALGVLAAVASIRLYRWVIGKLENRQASEVEPGTARAGWCAVLSPGSDCSLSWCC